MKDTLLSAMVLEEYLDWFAPKTIYFSVRGAKLGEDLLSCQQAIL